MWQAARSFSPRCGGESEIEGLGERKPPKLQISQVGGSVTGTGPNGRFEARWRGHLSMTAQGDCR
ncbi:hypothetical protein J2X08_002445 [Rhizobium rosettiformans]|nr:hypothetical protein [Rhizobium rosettiformans]MDR7064947.1 hypothetical protein [Rhizobium rosettiformans]